MTAGFSPHRLSPVVGERGEREGGCWSENSSDREGEDAVEEWVGGERGRTCISLSPDSLSKCEGRVAVCVARPSDYVTPSLGF